MRADDRRRREARMAERQDEPQMPDTARFVREVIQRAAVRGEVPAFRSVRELDERLRKLSYKCYWCDGPFEHIDHINPMSRGGSDRLRNLVPSCAACNLSKSNMPPSHWRALIKGDPDMLRRYPNRRRPGMREPDAA